MFYNKHYIRIDERKRIIHGFSDAFELPRDGDICINEQGGRQFAIDGVENPPLMTMEGVPLYEYKSKKVVRRADADIQADIDALTMPDKRAAKLAEISAACEQTIFAGIEVGGKCYALTTNDQINIQNLALQIQAGAETVLYHADGELCGPYSAEAIMALMDAAVRHVTYHTTYCNHLLVWVRRAESDELDSIFYGASLPEDLQEHLEALLGGVA